MNYEEAVAYIEETPKFTTKNKLEHTKECLRRLGSPEERFNVIHVAGTNGKGSTCAFLTSILREAGYSCGLFTSPHLVTINERFQINEKNIEDDTFLHAFEKVKKLADELVAEGSYHPTYFEFLFLMGMVIFADAGVDYVVLETGLGGKLDATTAVEHPLACVITSVIYDGNDPEVAQVISERAEELGSPCYEVKREDAKILRNTMSGIDFLFKNEYYGNTAFSIPFIAKYQVMNSMLALKTIEVMKNHIAASEDAVRRGIRETRWQGRMETVLPGVIVDGAHNEDGVEKFVETAAYFQKDYPLTLLFSAVDDKDYTDMIRTILDKISFRHVIVTQVGGYRKVPAEHLAEIFKEQGCPSAEACENVEMAFKKALEQKGEDGMLFCVGSLYLVGEIKTAILKGIGK